MLSRSLAIGALALMISGVNADEIEDQIAQGLNAYHDKDYKNAIDDLNYAIAQIQELQNASNAALLPEPLAGWTASDVENASAGMAMLGGGTTMSRTYQRDGESVEITVTAGSPMMTAALAMMSNPMLLANDPSMKPYRYKRIKGMQKTLNNRVEVTLALAGQIMLQLNAAGTQDDSSIKQYLDAMDMERMQQALLQ